MNTRFFMRKLSFLLTLLIPCLFSGCASTFLQIPTNRFSTSEVGSASEGITSEISFAMRRDDTMEFTADNNAARTLHPNYNSSNPATGVVNDAPGVDIPMSVAVGFAERFEAQLNLSFFFTPQELELKYQLLGETRATTGPGNFSLALSALIGAGPLNFGLHSQSDTNPVDWQLNETLLSEGIIAGYRITQGVLVYSGVFFNQAWVNVTRKEPNDPTLGAINSSYSGKAVSTTLNLGVELIPWVTKENSGGFIRAEIASSAFRMAGIADVNTAPLLGVQLGLRI